MAFTTREQDEMYTRKLEGFMDTQYHKVGILKSMERINDAMLQKKGIDIIMDDAEGIKYIDEKFAIDYRMKKLETYSFELSSGNNWNAGGWLINEHSLTTHYLLLWFNSDKEINQINWFEAYLIAKNDILQMLANDHINPYEVLEDFCSHNWDAENDGKFETITKWDGSTRRKMHIRDYVVVQSCQKEEAPINIIIPKYKLKKIASKIIQGNSTYNVQEEIGRMNNLATNICVEQPVVINQKAIALLSEKGIVSGNMWMMWDGKLKQGQIKNPEHKMEIVSKSQNGNFVRLAVYDKNFAEWAITHSVLEGVRGFKDTRVYPYKTYVRSIMSAGYVPIGFEFMDILHNKEIESRRTVSPQNGDKFVSFGEYTNGQKVIVEYNDLIMAYVVKNNSYITAKEIDRIGRIGIIREESVAQKTKKIKQKH